MITPHTHYNPPPLPLPPKATHQRYASQSSPRKQRYSAGCRAACATASVRKQRPYAAVPHSASDSASNSELPPAGAAPAAGRGGMAEAVGGALG